MDEPAHPFGFITGHVPLSGWDGEWRADPASVSMLARLPAEASITVVKRAPDGSETTRYSALVVQTGAPSPWIEVEATWRHRAVNVAGLMFEPGDTLREFFSALHPFNAFALLSPSGSFKGWYGNVTFPAFLTGEVEAPTLVWHDLYLDVVVLSDGSTSLLDDDELAESPLPRSDPGFASAIEAARLDLLAVIPTLRKLL